MKGPVVAGEIHNAAPSGRGRYPTDSQRTRPLRLARGHPVDVPLRGGLDNERNECSNLRMRRLLVLAGVVLLIPIGSAAAAPEAGANHCPLPPCPQVEGWSAKAPRAPNVDSELSAQFGCDYAKAGSGADFYMKAVWLRSAAILPRDAPAYTGCGYATENAPTFRKIHSKTHFVSLGYGTAGNGTGGSPDAFALWASEQERFTKAALVLLTATESLAKPCPGQAPPPTPPPSPPASRDTKSPTVHADNSSGYAGSTIKLRHSVRDNLREARGVAAVYAYPGKRLIWRNTGDWITLTGNPYWTRSYPAPRNRVGNFAFCVYALDRAGNRSTESCAALVIYRPKS